MQLNPATRRRNHTLWAGVSAVFLALAISFSLFAVAGGGSAAVSGGSEQNAVLLKTVLGGLNADPGSVSFAASAPAFANAGTEKWLTVTQPQPVKTTAQSEEYFWYAALIAGGYGSQCVAEKADCLAGFTYTEPNGARENDFTSRIVIQPVRMTAASPAELSATITERLAAQGVSGASITFTHPFGPAAIVEIKASDPQAVVTALNVGSTLGDLGLDGYLVKIDDANGNVVFVDAVADRAGVGRAWSAPGLNVPNTP